MLYIVNPVFENQIATSDTTAVFNCVKGPPARRRVMNNGLINAAALRFPIK